MNQGALESASNIYNYYYSHAIKEFDKNTSMYLAQIPADYVYNSLINQRECYIDKNCCLEHCNEILNLEFNKLDPSIKRKAYEKMMNVKAGYVSDIEIDTQLKKRRNNKFKQLYYNKFNELKENRDDNFNGLFKNMGLNNSLDDIFKTLNLN